jgi:hypothetical protein
MHVSGITFIRYAQHMHVSGITFIRYAQHMHVSGITFIRYAQRMHVSGITFIKPAIVTTSIRQYTGIMRTSFEFLFTVHFILIKLVFSNHVSYVTLFQCSFPWKVT